MIPLDVSISAWPHVLRGFVYLFIFRPCGEILLMVFRKRILRKFGLVKSGLEGMRTLLFGWLIKPDVVGLREKGIFLIALDHY